MPSLRLSPFLFYFFIFHPIITFSDSCLFYLILSSLTPPSNICSLISNPSLPTQPPAPFPWPVLSFAASTSYSLITPFLARLSYSPFPDPPVPVLILYAVFPWAGARGQAWVSGWGRRRQRSVAGCDSLSSRLPRDKDASLGALQGATEEGADGGSDGKKRARGKAKHEGNVWWEGAKGGRKGS